MIEQAGVEVQRSRHRRAPEMPRHEREGRARVRSAARCRCGAGRERSLGCWVESVAVAPHEPRLYAVRPASSRSAASRESAWRLELADAFAREVELVADRFERPRLALEAEPQLEDPPLAFGERVERLADVLAAQRLLGLVERVGGFAVGEEVAELALAVGADRLVERDRC